VSSCGTANDRIVFVVDDDDRIRESLSDLLSSVGLSALTFGSAIDYIKFSKPDLPACLILDVELPDINGLEFQSQLVQEDHPPIIFITGHGTIPSSVRAIKAGAIDFLTKPFSRSDLLRALETAFTQDQRLRLQKGELAELRRRFSLLTPREREVLPLVVAGLLNKQAAAELGISGITFQIHRGHVMQKMAASSLADLVRMAGKLEISVPTWSSTTYTKDAALIDGNQSSGGSGG
jgi:FixJ family two-component response regulator